MARGTHIATTTLTLLMPMGALVVLMAAEAQAATPTYYNSLVAFQAEVTTTVTDPYSNPGYVFVQSDAAMSAVLGQTDYMATGHLNVNIVSGGVYCAGCNGSFELSFQSTTVGNAAGVVGVGASIQFNDPGTPYFAFITFADGTTANIQLPAAGTFWGVAAPERIERIHFGLSNGGTTQGGSFGIDNLIIGDGNVGTCMVPGDCTDDLDPCTDQACVGGVCTYPFNAGPCDDGEVCTENDVCNLGLCQGVLVDCSDENPCTTNFCDFGVGCAMVNNTDPCDDGDACTELDACAGGACGGASVNCSDDDVCTMDSCDPSVGCSNEAVGGCCDSDEDCAAGEACDVASNTCTPGASGSSDGGMGESSDGGPGSTSAPGETGVDGTGDGESGVGTSSGAETSAGGSSGADTGNGFDDAETPDFSVCECTTTPSPQGRLWWLMAGLGLFARRRRRAA